MEKFGILTFYTLFGCLVGGILGFLAPFVIVETNPQLGLFGIFVSGPIGMAIGGIVAFNRVNRGLKSSNPDADKESEK